MALTTMMANEYANLRGVSNQCVCKALRKAIEKNEINSKTLYGIKRIDSYGRSYKLDVDVEAVKKYSVKKQK